MTRDILMGARTLLSNPDAWGQAHFVQAGKRCIAQAVIDAAGQCGLKNSNGTIQVLQTTVGATNICTWNDMPGRTHADVLAAFDAAIRNSVG